MEIVKVIAVIVAVFLHRGNGRAITSTSNDTFEGMLGLLEEELNTAVNETNGKSSEREENPADFLRLVEPDLPSQETLQSLSNDVSGESSISPNETAIIWRHKRSLDREPDCYKTDLTALKLASGKIELYHECRLHPPSTSIACSLSSQNQRKCVVSEFKAVTIIANGKKKVTLIPQKCSCAP